MSDVEQLKADLKRASAKAIQAKMDLHDLSEELPVSWETIPAGAARTHEAYAELTRLRAALKQAESA